MEKSYQSPGISLNAFTATVLKNSQVPDSFIKMTVRFGLAKSLNIVIHRRKFKRMCKRLYRIDLFRTIMNNFDRLDEPLWKKRILLWLNASSIVRKRIYKTEKYFNRV